MVIGKGVTADGVHVRLWDSGSITGMLGLGLPGVPIVRPSCDAAKQQALTAGWLLLGDLALYDCSELGAAYIAARKTASGDGQPGTMRRIFAESTKPALLVDWEIVTTDAHGQPTERFARLPALRWPGLAVWDFCGAAGSAGGRYRIMRSIYTDERETTVLDTGLRFATWSGLIGYLEAI